MSKKQLISDVEFENLLSKYDYNFKKGDLIKGTVCGYDSEGAIVDIGSKASAIVPLREASIDSSKKIEEALEKNKEYEFLIIREEDEDGKLLLSSKKVNIAYAWKELEGLKASDETILASITSVVKGGLLVDVQGVVGFVPSSQLLNKESNLTVGDKIELKILTLDSQNNSFILSNKKVYSESMAIAKNELFAQIEVGQVVKGEVVRISDFGAFVNIGGTDALLPLSQISWKWVEHPSDVLTVGDNIEVEVISVDKEKQRVSLSLKTLEQDPWVEVEKELNAGSMHEGVVTRIKSFGAFVEIYPGVEALLPQSELAWYRNNNNSDVTVGQKINTYILKFNPQDKRISLSFSAPAEQELEPANV